MFGFLVMSVMAIAHAHEDMIVTAFDAETALDWYVVNDNVMGGRSNGGFEISMDRAFGAVIAACAAPRAGSEGTWITDDMSAAYTALHQRGIAHSVECWRDGKLAGGLYGLAIGRVFFGESMFARERDASKVALCTLAERLLDWDYELIDCQVGNDHLRRLGAMDMRRTEFNETLARLCALEPAAGAWSE